MNTDRRQGHVERDGVRVFDDARGSRRRVTAIVVASVVVTVLGLMLFRGAPETPVAREASGLPNRADDGGGQPTQAGPRAIRKIPAAPVDRVAKDDRHGRRMRPAPPPNPVVDPAQGSSPPTPSESDDSRLERVARDVIARMKASGATGGLAAFPPPGTDPIKPGLVVPENFELPEGYVRHYQTTDDGQRLEAILMFSPDYEFVDASGRPIKLPNDGIVPSEMAPPGLPLRTLEVPKSSHKP